MSFWSIGATAILGLLGLISVIAFFKQLRFERELARDGRTVVGTVIERVDAGGDGYHIRVEYTIDNVTYTVLSHQPQVEDVGTKVDVRFLPGKPLDPRLQVGRLEARVGTIESLAGVVIFLGGAIATAILGMYGVF